MAYTMAGARVPTQRKFRMGKVLGTSIRIYLRHIVAFTLITLGVWMPMIIGISVLLLVGTVTPYGYVIPGVNPVAGAQISAGTMGATFLVTLILLPIGLSIIFNATFQYLREGRAHIGASIKRGFARTFWVILVWILAFLGMAAVVGIMMLVLATGMAGIALMTSQDILKPQPGSPREIIIGFVAILPVIIPAIMWSVAIPACVIERLGPIASLGRSRSLTKGHRWQILGILFVAILGVLLISIAVRVGLVVTLRRQTIWFVLIGFVLQSALNAFMFVIPGVIYHDLRLVKENIDIQKVATVFD